MDTQAQMQAIVDRLTGASFKTRTIASDLDEPWRTIYRRATPATARGEAERLIQKATIDLPHGRQLARDLIALLPDDAGFHPFPSLHEVSARFPPVDWLWPSWIPNSMVSLFGAAPGAGKSLVALDLARRIISGQPFPDGAPVPCPGRNVLIVDAEGTPALLNQRAQAWNIDSRNLYIMLASDASGLVNLADRDQQIQFIKMCLEIKPVLVIIDSLAAASTLGETSLTGARTILGFLATIARKAGPAILVIHHLRKRSGSGRSTTAPRIVADDLRGSSHLSAAARSVLALSVPARPPTRGQGSHSAPPPPKIDPPSDKPFPDSPPASAPYGPPAQSHPALSEMRRLEVVKTNLCRHPPPLGLIFEGTPLSVPTLRYTEYVEPPPPPSQVELCAGWLLQLLATAGEPVKPGDVVRAARQMGFSRPTLYRARQSLAGTIVDLGNSPQDPNKRWALAAAPSPLPPSQ